eukprot:jgi/Tetstr1/459150/TSEL_004597.t1
MRIEYNTCGTRVRTSQDEIAPRYLKAHPVTIETMVDSPLLKLPVHLRLLETKAKPDPKAIAPAAKPKPKANRKPAATKSKSKSKEPLEPRKGGRQRKATRGVRDYHKRHEKEAATSTTMETLE